MGEGASVRLLGLKNAQVFVFLWNISVEHRNSLIMNEKKHANKSCFSRSLCYNVANKERKNTMPKPHLPAIPSEVQAMLDHMVASTDEWIKQQKERNARLQRENAEIDRRIQRELFMAEKSRKKRQKELAKQNQIG